MVSTMRFKYLIIPAIVVLALVITVLAGCSSRPKSPITPDLPPTPVPVPAEVQQITFEQLFSDSNQYNGKEIVMEGFYYQGFETIVLSERLDYSGHAPGHLVPGGRMLWLEGGMPKEIYDKAYQQQMLGPLERYGKVRIKGQFEYGGSTGIWGKMNIK